MALRRFVHVGFIALLLLVAGASAARAAVYVHAGTTTGNVLAAGSTISSSTISGNMVFASSTGNITCSTASFSETVGASGGGTVTGSISSMTFGSAGTPCTDTIAFTNITQCSASSGSVASGTTATTSGDTTSIPLTVTTTIDCPTSLGTHCYLAMPSVPAVADHTFVSNTITESRRRYNSVTFTRGTGSDFSCPSTGTFSGVWTAVKSFVGALLGWRNNS